MRDYVAARVNSIPPSGIRKFFDIAATMKDVISLGIGEPDFTTPDPIIKAGIGSLQNGETHYTSNSGTLELRRSLNGYLQRRYGVEYDPEAELLITVGVSEALYLALTAILDPGDEVIVPQPCFVAYTAEVTLAGGVPVPIATRVENSFMVTRAEIEAQITPRTKAILIGYPNNPTGAVMSRERLLDIAQLAATTRSRGHLGRDLRSAGVWLPARRHALPAHVLPHAAGHARSDDPARRLLASRTP